MRQSAGPNLSALTLHELAFILLSSPAAYKLITCSTGFDLYLRVPYTESRETRKFLSWNTVYHRARSNVSLLVVSAFFPPKAIIFVFVGVYNNIKSVA